MHYISYSATRQCTAYFSINFTLTVAMWHHSAILRKPRIHQKHYHTSEERILLDEKSNGN